MYKDKQKSSQITTQENQTLTWLELRMQLKIKNIWGFGHINLISWNQIQLIKPH